MNWRDFLYFSKGERRALTLLLCLITISWILLLWTEKRRMPIHSQTDAHETENRPASDEKRIIIGKDTSGRTTEPFSAKSVSRRPHSAPAKNNISHTKTNRKKYTPYTRSEKYAPGTLVELNSADTTILKKVPGIGSTFARRIIKYLSLIHI